MQRSACFVSSLPGHLLPVLALASTAACFSVPTARIIPRYGELSVGGDVKASPPGPLTASASLDALGLGDSTGAFLPRVDVDWSRLHLTGQGFDVGFMGTGVADAELDFGGGGITVGTPVDSKLDFKMLSASAMFDIFPRWILEVGIGAGGGLVSFDFDVRSQVGPEAISVTRDDLPIGFLSGRIAKRILGFEAVVLANGVGFSYEGDSVEYYNIDANLGYRISSKGVDISLIVGYLLHHFEADYADQGGNFETKLDLQGPYGGIVLSL